MSKPCWKDGVPKEVFRGLSVIELIQLDTVSPGIPRPLFESSRRKPTSSFFDYSFAEVVGEGFKTRGGLIPLMGNSLKSVVSRRKSLF